MNSVYVLEAGKVDNFDWIGFENGLQKIFDFRIKKIGPVDVPDFAFNPEKKQYDAEKILLDMQKIEFEDLEKILIVTDKDLYALEYNYIFGQGDCPGRQSIVSTFRLHDKDKKLFANRVLKESIHELGHNFGLSHCPDKKCPMHFSNNILDTDLKEAKLCEKCGNLLAMID
ncbi:MAG: archaemetzincin family Zn-dependent metalloprotease [Patescibacteria group bacterium]|nr:archaemetzincin family Zn-dependent metalloprotease [Patescibacteria group bacterium]